MIHYRAIVAPGSPKRECVNLCAQRLGWLLGKKEGAVTDMRQKLHVVCVPYITKHCKCFYIRKVYGGIMDCNTIFVRLAMLA